RQGALELLVDILRQARGGRRGGRALRRSGGRSRGARRLRSGRRRFGLHLGQHVAEQVLRGQPLLLGQRRRHSRAARGVGQAADGQAQVGVGEGLVELLVGARGERGAAAGLADEGQGAAAGTSRPEGEQFV